MGSFGDAYDDAMAGSPLPIKRRSSKSAGRSSDLASQILVKKPLDRCVGMPPLALPCEPVLGSRIHHDIEGLAQILQLAKQLGAVQEQHIVVCHAVHHQELALQIWRIRQR